MIDSCCSDVASNTQNSNTERENKPLRGVQSRPKGRKSMRLQPRRAANEKHACHDNGYGFLAVRLMVYSRAAPEPLHAGLQETSSYMERLPPHGVKSHCLAETERNPFKPTLLFVRGRFQRNLPCNYQASRKKFRWTWAFCLKGWGDE